MPEAPMKVYISGPISGLEEVEYLRNFAEGAEFISSEGFIPVNPLEVVPDCTDACESGLSFEDGRYMHTWKCYMKADIKALLDCDAIFVLPHPKTAESRGVKLEVAIARSLNLQVMVLLRGILSIQNGGENDE